MVQSLSTGLAAAIKRVQIATAVILSWLVTGRPAVPDLRGEVVESTEEQPAEASAAAKYPVSFDVFAKL